MSVVSSIMDYVKAIPKSKTGKIIGYCFGITAVLTVRKVVDIIHRKWYKLPSGPIGLPLFGSIYTFINFKDYINFKRKYGVLCMFNFGYTRVCFINDYKLYKSIFSRKNEKNLTKVPIIDNGGNNEEYPIIFLSKQLQYNNNNTFVIERRKLLQRSVVSKLNCKVLLLSTSHALNKYVFPTIDNCVKNNMKWDIRKEMNYLTFANVYGSIFGCYYPPPSDAMVMRFKKLNYEFIENSQAMLCLSMLFPYNSMAAYIGKKCLNLIKFDDGMTEQHEILDKWIEMYHDHSNKSSMIDDSIDKNELYYNILQDTISKGLYGMNDNKAKTDMITAFMGGSHTITTALEQGILYLAYVGISVQSELFNEINGFLMLNNNDFSFIIKYRNRLPKLSSFIYELLRIHGLTVATSPYYTTKSMQIEINKNEYVNIPKNTALMPNIVNIHHNSDNWKNNNNDLCSFNWQRFINPETKKFEIKNEQIVTFGLGARKCAGFDLALREIYLILAMLIQRYQFDSNNNDSMAIPKYFLSPNTPLIGVNVTLRN